ncbi:MAG: amidase, partial [Pseudomonadota bacterium]
MSLVQTDPLNAFMKTDGPAIPAKPDGPLSGYSLAVKDIFDVAGHRTGCGNPQKLEEATPATQTATAVQVLLDAGAEFIGKTQTEELAFSLTGDNAHYPRPINPAAPDRVTGGSSSGSVAAVAGGLADIATGSDTGGSVRAPASYCGLIGLRTTHGLISLAGTMPLAASLDTFGWFTRDTDLYVAIGTLLLPKSDIGFARIFRLPEQETMLAGAAEREAYETAVWRIMTITGKTSETRLNALDIEQRYWSFRKVQSYEAWQAHGDWISSAERKLGPGVKDRFAFGSSITKDEFAAASKSRSHVTEEFADLLAQDGLVIMPT